MGRKLFALAIACAIIAFSTSSNAQAPVASFSANNTSGCSPVVVQFTDQSTGSPTSWFWDLGNGGNSTLQNPAASYITPGTYTVILTATNSNGSTKDTGYITVYAQPTIDFTTDTTTTCNVKTVTFTNNTTAGAVGAVSYLWDFGDGDSSTAVSPTHTYTNPGTYAVTLVATNSNGCTNSLTKNNYINVLPPPTVGFTANTTTSCNAPLQVNFTNNTTSATSYAWDFGDGNTSTSTNPSNNYTTSGTYDVQLISTSSNGCKDTLTKSGYIAIGQVNADFTFGPSCASKFTQFTNTTTPAPGSSRIWRFGTADTSSTVSPSYKYVTPGTYTVTLIEQYSGGCSDSVSKSVTVSANPTVNFYTADTVGCTVPFSANFTNTSTGATSYLWDFSPGTSTATSPSNNYTSLGYHTVTLTGTNAAGCSSTTTKAGYIKLAEPTASLSILPDTGGCPNESLQFTAMADSPLYANNYRWDFGDGTSPVTCACSTQNHAYTSTGTYTVTIVVYTATGCDDTLQQTVTISSKPTAAFSGSPLTICPDVAVNFTNSSTGATTYSWSFGDGGNSNLTAPSHVYEQAGNYDVELIAFNNACSDTALKTTYITVNLPVADFDPGFTCGTPLTYTFQDNSQSANTYYWDFGDGNTSTTSGTVSHTYASAGTYNVMLVVYNTSTTCYDTLIKTIEPTILTVPSFTVSDSNFCAGDGIVMMRGGGYELTYAWYIGPFSTTNQNPAPGLTLSSAGTFDLKLVVTDSFGCKDSVVRSNYIRVGGATPGFIVDDTQPCKLEPVLFTDTTTSGAFPTTNRLWVFGDGTQDYSSTDTISHVYNNGGAYAVKLVVTDSLGCKDSITKSNYLNVNAPSANFYTSDTVVCPGDTVAFSNNSGGVSFTSLWNFGDGNTSTDLTPDHVYAALGTYTVSIVVTDSFGCQDSNTKTNYIDVQQPTAAFTMSDSVAACPPLTVYMTNNSVNGSTYLWTFGNGNQSTNANPSVSYVYPGTYTVTLVTTNPGGCTDTATRTVTINGPTGSLSYSPKDGCNPLTVQFTATSSNTTSYFWDMNDGNTQSTSSGSFSYTYTQTGKYLPSVILTDGASCQVPLQINDTVTVDAVTADFSYVASGSFCNTDTIHFDDTVSFSLSNITNRSWDFGDGGTSSVADPSHYYNSPGNYTVRLIATNANGCEDTVTKTVTINGLPNVAISSAADSICPGQPTGAQLTATGADTYTWTPTTGLSCTSCANPDANPQVTTTYIVTGTDTNGCTSNDTVTIGLKPKPVLTVSNDTSICEDLYAPLTVSGAYTYSWTPSGTLSCSGCTNPSATPGATTNYTVIGTNASGCKDTGNVIVTVLLRPSISAGGSKTICIGDTALLIASGADTYTWTPTGTLSCSSCDSTYAYPTTTTGYTAIGTAANGCKDTSTVSVTVRQLPSVDAGGDQDICIGDTAFLQANGAITYTWTPTGTLTDPNIANPKAFPTSTTSYIVTGTDANSCSNTDTMVVTVNPLPTVSAGTDKTICVGFSTQLQATAADTYAWSPSTGLNNSTVANPTASPTGTTLYVVTGTDVNSCINKDTVIVTVNPQPSVNAGSSQNICPGDTVQMQATGADSYVWSPTAGLTNPNIANPKASPAATTSYSVVGTDLNGCKDTANVAVNVNTPPVLTTNGNQTICINDSATLQANGAATYTWSPTTGLSDPNIGNPKASPATTTTYTIIGINGSSCKDTTTLTVTVNPLPTVNAGSDKTICVGFDAQLNATGTATSYVWTPTTGLSNPNIVNPTAGPTTTTIYVVTGTDANTCSNTDTVVVNVNPQPTVNAGSNQNICPADTVQLQATGANTYVWTPTAGLSNPNIADPKASPATTTNYSAVGTDANGCMDTATVTVNVNSKPVVTTNGNQAICIGDSVQLQASGAASYTWMPGTGLNNTAIANPKASPSTTTTYTVIGINGSSCKDTTTLTVTVNPLPTVNAGTDKTICVGFSTQLNATGTATTHSWTPTTGLNNPNINNPTASPTTTTTYVVTGTDANTCVNTDTVVVNVNPQPTVNAGSNQSICPADTVQLQATGANTYVWTPTGGLSNPNIADPKASPATTTNYSVVGTDGNGCMDTATVTVNVNSKPVVTTNGNQAICIGDSVQLQASGAASYTWMPGTGLNNTAIANPKASPSTTTTYTVIGINGSSCKDTTTLTVTVNPLPTVNAGTDKTICVGFSTQLNATGTATTHTWSPTTGLNNPNINNPTAGPTTTTTYVVTGTDANTCVNTDTVVVNVNPQPTVNAGSNQSICPADTVQLQATGANTYVWTPTAGLSNPNIADPKASPPTTTNYSVVGTDGNGCMDTATVTVNVNAPPSVTTNGNQAICIGDNVQLQASGATNYTWSPSTGLSNTGINNPVADPTTTTTYTVIGENGNGCKDTASLTVTVNPLPAVSAGSDKTICIGFSSTLNGVAATATGITWTPAGGLSSTTTLTPTANPTTTTTYVLTVQDANTCSNSDTVVVNVNPQPTVSAGNNQNICPADSAQLQASGADSYAWSPAAGLSNVNIDDPKASPVSTTTYYVVGEDANGCKDTSSAVVTVNTPPVVSAGSDVDVCIGDSVQLNATGVPNDYTWSPATGLGCINCQSPNASPTDTTTYTVVGTDANGCKDTATVTVRVKPLPVISVSAGRTLVCIGDTTLLMADGADSYTWAPGGSVSCATCDTTVGSPLSNTRFIATGTLNGCSDTAGILINVYPLPAVDAGPDTAYCIGVSDTLKATGADYYTWTPAIGLSCTNCSEPVVNINTTTTFKVTGTVAANGCTNTDSITITIHSLPEINAGEDRFICEGDSVQLNASGASSYIWSPATGLSCTNCSSPNAITGDTITYVVTGTDAQGCVNTDEIKVSAILKQEISYSKDDSICLGETISLNASGGTSYNWSPAAGLGNTDAANTDASPTATTDYRVIIRQGDCFTDTGFTKITVFNPPEIDAGPDQELRGSNEVRLEPKSTGAVSFIWSPDENISCTECRNPLVTPLKDTRYTIKAISAFGCEAEDDVTVFITCSADQLFIANTFTPNGDGINDIFFPQGKGLTNVKRFSIYTRWGQLVHDVQNIPLNDPAFGWDGTFKADPLKPDVFVYIISAECEDGSPVQLKGDISLIR